MTVIQFPTPPKPPEPVMFAVIYCDKCKKGIPLRAGEPNHAEALLAWTSGDPRIRLCSCYDSKETA